MEEASSGYRILIADDDRNVHQSLGVYFKKEGYQVLSAYEGEEAVRLVRHSHPDMMILDIMMPKMDGMVVCREVRKFSNLPIIMLTAKGEEFDKLLGLELGADDYIAKPFSPRELLARVKAVLRRIYEFKDEEKGTQLAVSNLEIDLSAYTVKLNGETVACTPKEIEILWLLASNPGTVFSREQLLQNVWGYDFTGETRAVDSHIKRIRAKLSAADNPWDIRTVWGVGYRFEIME